MATRYPTFRPQRVNGRFLGSYVGNGGGESPNIVKFQYDAPATLDANGILAAQSLTTASGTSTFESTYLTTEAVWTRYGRNVTAAGSSTTTSTISVFGRDYMGQPMKEVITLADTATIQGVKAFRYIDYVSWSATSAVTVNVGWGNYLGVPYKCFSMLAEIKNSAIAANAGTFVAGLVSTSPGNNTTTDPRGLYLPVTVIPNGSVVFRLRCIADAENIFGNAHFYAAPT